MKKKTFAGGISLVCALLLMGCSIAGAGTSKKSDTEQAEAIQYTIADADELIGKAERYCGCFRRWRGELDE